ncbi:DUF262 domain-containing protein [Hassallia byssoidea VB512170]|uniref:DUF262 domain-containing protein n=1 Tax=Hassallia byssoidea VB512170 TaxID=1304833 RepID=A0A846H8X5_9CYAN|nr:DUF262 domain-containing protein [Hassalia byssoidea]NEU72941.1 DUF262 domain-containing protein [Hassalia byssoidea VB512170]
MSTFQENRDGYPLEGLADEEQETQIEENQEDEDDDILPSRFSISVSRTDFDVEGIVKRLRNDDIYIPDFQRAYVWKPKQASRLVESLLLNLPVPGIFLAKDSQTNKLLVLDGQQRLISVKSFYEGKFPNSRTSFSLKGVHREFEGKKYESLLDAERRQLDNSVLSATVIEPRDNNEESIYYIFERLNTGGTLLKPQEIRACIFHGNFNDLIGEMNNNEAWRNIFGNKEKNKKDQELILRFIALYFEGNNYKPSLKKFLNNFMNKNRQLNCYSQAKIEKAFIPTIEIINKCIGNKAFKGEKGFVPTFFEAVMVGIAKRLESGNIENFDEFKKQYNTILSNKNFLAISVKIRDLTNEHNLKERLRMATETFADLQ